jgi:hypothetical protein
MTSRETYEEVVRAVDSWPDWTHIGIELLADGG